LIRSARPHVALVDGNVHSPSGLAPEIRSVREVTHMTEVTRRGFLRTASLGTAAFGILAAVPGAVFAQQQPQGAADQDDGDESPADSSTLPASAPASALAPIETPSPWLLYVRDAGRGELALLSGEQELIFTDPDLLARVQQVASGGQGRSMSSDREAPEIASDPTFLSSFPYVATPYQGFNHEGVSTV
jgi:hypothetical protein